MTEKLCLLDWNGTIQDDLHHLYECGVQRIFRHFRLPCPSIDTYRDEVKADFMPFYHSHGIPDDVTAAYLNDLMAEGYKEKGTPPALFPDAADTLRTLAGRGYALMVVSGYAKAKLDAAVSRSGLGHLFSRVVGDVRDKPRALAACFDPTERPSVLCKIGDTVEDLLAAKYVGAVPYICPRGFHTRERIESHRHDAPSMVLIDTLADVLQYLP
jgi:phosphoglycolate phosphatase-like HAD superfamily hydrolase